MRNIFFLASFAILLGCSMPTTKATNVYDFNSIPQDFRVRDARKICGNLVNGHGPYLRCSSSKKDKELWFWFSPKENLNPDEFKIAFISEGDPDNPDTQAVVWPKHFQGKSLSQVYQEVYGDMM